MKHFLYTLPLLILNLAGCATVPIASYAQPGHCFWMENVSGQFNWVSTQAAGYSALDKQACFELDSCDGGAGRSGGGCYKWADYPEAPRQPW